MFKVHDRVISNKFGIGYVTFVDEKDDVVGVEFRCPETDEVMAVRFNNDGHYFLTGQNDHFDIRPLWEDMKKDVEVALCAVVLFGAGIFYGWMQWGMV